MTFNLYVLTEIFTYGFSEESLIFTSLISVIFSIFVIIIKNPIVSVLLLIGLFLSISIYLVSLGFFFLGLSYILVYIGAVSILFIFILMLINIRVSELLSETKNSIPLAIIITVFISIVISEFIPENLSDFDNTVYFFKESLDFNINNINNSNNYITYVSSESWDNHLIGTDYISSVGNVLYTNYCIWLILTSIILLLAMVGCIVVTMRQQ